MAGETGSGKSTQLPKMCLEAGRGVAGMIGHTQPRRIAARSVAERVAEELGADLRAGGRVQGPVHRPGQRRHARKGHDRRRAAWPNCTVTPNYANYDTLIIDEAHERSLNIDFILGYLKRLLPSRPDLKVIVTSATIDTETVLAAFRRCARNRGARAAPIRSRSGTGPWPKPGDDGNDDEPMDEVQAVCDAVADLCREGPGDILVFLPGEREIRDTADALGQGRPCAGLEVLASVRTALVGRTAPDFRAAHRAPSRPGHQRGRDISHRARDPLRGRPRDGADFPLRPAHQGPAAPDRADIPGVGQPESRALRPPGPGICVRLYSEEDFAARRPFTEPEILRTNLASVILQMAAIGLGDIENFPFMDPPDRRNITDGIALLEELGAFLRAGPVWL